jgi:hypothetical protein
MLTQKKYRLVITHNLFFSLHVTARVAPPTISRSNVKLALLEADFNPDFLPILRGFLPRIEWNAHIHCIPRGNLGNIHRSNTKY